MSGDTKILLPAAEIAQRTDPGRDPQKQINEDTSGYKETRLGHLCVVCDGMGGHTGGREASMAALATIMEAFDLAPAGARPDDVLRDAITLAHLRVRALAAENEQAHPGSTVVAVLLHAGGTEVAHVGDSRVYLVHEGQIFQITRDHSMVQEMVDARILTPAQAAVHPDANKITRALGIDDSVDVDVRATPVLHVAGDTFVLCTDGLSDLVEANEILQITSSDPPTQAVGKLVDLANARGGHDNITVQILRARVGAAGARVSLPDTVVQTVPEPVTEPPMTPRVQAPIPRAAFAEDPARARRRASIALGAGVLLAVVGVAIAVVVLYVNARERAARRERASDALSAPLPSASTHAPAVLSLAPQPLEGVPGEAPRDVDAGLAPLIDPSVRHSRKHPQEPR
jgi:serine/threonine protein phosphatase PrpC